MNDYAASAIKIANIYEKNIKIIATENKLIENVNKQKKIFTIKIQIKSKLHVENLKAAKFQKIYDMKKNKTE